METSDDFYSTMGVLIQDVLTGNVIDCQTLMQVKFPMDFMISLHCATFFDESFGLFLADVYIRRLLHLVKLAVER